MSDCLTQSISNNSNESVETSLVRTTMESMPQQSQQTPQQSTQQSPTAQLLIGQQMSPIVTSMDVSQQNQNSVNDSSNSSVNVSMNGTLISSNVSDTQNSMSSNPSVTTSMASVSVSNAMPTQGSIQGQNTQSPQLIVSSSQSQLAPTTQSTHLNAANGIMAQLSGATITSMANQTMQMTAQTAQHNHNQMQPLLQTSVQQTAGNQMSVTMSSLPQVQVIQQGIGGTPGTYQLQQVYPQGMLLPGNLTIQNMPFGTNQGLSLQIPFSSTGGVSTGTMPITSIASKPPIMSKGVAISPLTQSQHHMISPLKPQLSAQTQILKQMLPTQQFIPHSTTNQTVVFSQLLPQQNQHSVHQSILPNTNKTLLEAQKGKPFGMGSVRSSFGNKMLSHSAAIQPKSPILPATSISSPLLANSQFKTPFGTNTHNTQLIQTPSNLITNPQILNTFQTLGPHLWTTSPQSTHLVAPNGSPIFIRGPGQGGEHMFISTSNMSNPQIQAVSMSAPINVQNSVHTPIQVSTATTQVTQHLPQTLQNTTLQTISVNSNVNTTTSTTTPVITSQSQVTVPTPTTSANKQKISRQNSSTQTASPALAQKVESTTNLKPIAPAKPKPSVQQIAPNNKQNLKDVNSTTMRSTSVGTTQTVNQPTVPTSQSRTQSNKSDASNQTNKLLVSVATETSKVNSQVSSSRIVSDVNRHMSVKNNNSTETNESKVNSVSEPIKTPPKKVVEKRDASTEQDLDISANSFAQNNHKSIQNSVQTTNNVNQLNGQQIPVLSDLNRQDLSKQPQKAIVKPQKSQILTHVIDGYIIKESANPFPVNGLSYSSDNITLNEEKSNNSVEIIKSKNKNENSLNSSASSSKNRSNSDRFCLNCGAKRKSNSKTAKIKRFCSQMCTEKYNSNNNKNSANSSRLVLYNSVTGHLEDNDLQKAQEIPMESTTDLQKQTEEKKKTKSLKRTHENSNDLNATKNGDTNIGIEVNNPKAAPIAETSPAVKCVLPNVSANEEMTNSAIAGLYIPPGGRNPLQWTVNDVYEFVRNLQGCTEYADEFRSQEIDGQALMLIKEDHLMNTMNMKLGPALKICSKINALREDVQKQS